MSKYGHRAHNWFESIVNKIGGEEAAERFLRDELTISEPVRSWRERDGVIYFWVTSDGTTGEEWITRLESKGFCVEDYAEQALRSSDFKPTNGLTIAVAVLKGMLFEIDDRVTLKIRVAAAERKLEKPSAELACLIREKFTDTEIRAMGLSFIVAMHEPVDDFYGDPILLQANRGGDGRHGRGLSASHDRPNRRWVSDSGFAFAVATSSSQAGK